MLSIEVCSHSELIFTSSFISNLIPFYLIAKLFMLEEVLRICSVDQENRNLEGYSYADI